MFEWEEVEQYTFEDSDRFEEVSVLISEPAKYKLVLCFLQIT